MKFFIFFLFLAFAVADEEVELKFTNFTYLDMSVDGISLGRIKLGLYGDIVPKTVKNFLELCKRPEGSGYKGSRIHTVMKYFIIQGGDYEYNNGTGGKSIYGPTFDDENFKVKYVQRGTLAMGNRGYNTNGSQFFITLASAEVLNGKNVAFGHVVDGWEVVKKIGDLPTKNNGKPNADVRITNCAEHLHSSS